MKPTLLIDGDHSLYVATASCEREVWGWDEDPDAHILFCDFDEARQVFVDRIAGYTRDLGAKQVVLGFTGPENFRYDVDPTYKGQRKSRKPLCYYRLLNHIFTDKAFTARMNVILEADDLMGIWATNGKVKDPIIVSEDKDMKTIPGRLYRKGVLHEISTEEADHFWHMQVLAGDPTDGYFGCPGIGMKTADKLLASKDHWWQTVVGVYEKKGLTEADAVVQAQLSRILRSEDWNSETKEVILWQPR